LNGSITIILVAYLLGKSILGLGAVHHGAGSIAQSPRRGMVAHAVLRAQVHTPVDSFCVSSNISATIIKIFRESELIWIGFFLDTTAVGYYRVAYTIVHFLAIPADPLISTTFPEINRLAVEQAWGRLKSFLRKITAFSFAYNIALGAGLILFGRWVILIYSGEEYLNAYPALIALTIGLVFNYILFWNRPLLLSLGCLSSRSMSR
jgi:O-antigen/teichoic acid export membrane protein